jgi:hypothetical protein
MRVFIRYKDDPVRGFQEFLEFLFLNSSSSGFGPDLFSCIPSGVPIACSHLFGLLIPFAVHNFSPNNSDGERFCCEHFRSYPFWIGTSRQGGRPRAQLGMARCAASQSSEAEIVHPTPASAATTKNASISRTSAIST